MDNQKLKDECKDYLVQVLVRIIQDGKKETMYATEYKPGLSRSKKLLPLGWFKTENEALQALYDYLKANDRI